jgi:hypothetical protein
MHSIACAARLAHENGMVTHESSSSALGAATNANLGERLQLPGLVIVFLVVFYNQHCYERYKKYVDIAYTIIRQVLQITQELAVYLGSENPEVRNASRFMQAAHHLVYYQVRLLSDARHCVRHPAGPSTNTVLLPVVAPYALPDSPGPRVADPNRG